MIQWIKLLVFALYLAPLMTHAVVIVDNTTQGLYNNGLGDIHTIDGPGGFLLGPNSSEGDPTIVLGADPALDFSLFSTFGNDWLGGDYSGGTWSSGPVAIPTTWTVNTETAIVYDLNLATASNLHIDLGVDNGIIVWLDGIFVFGATRAGGASLNEYDIDLANIVSGTHSLQILRADHGGSTGYAILVDATDAPIVSVPEPGALWLIMIGLIGIWRAWVNGGRNRV